MSEVVVTGIGPLLANCCDRHTLWRQLRDGPSQLAFEPAPGATDGERWPVDRSGRRRCGNGGLTSQRDDDE
ncbi:MAG TPA: hypothetical protein VFP84_10800, partial [Kofleriaceae bacterium]|nr:hypothetical protein [Kofleriaceae bacterium]